MAWLGEELPAKDQDGRTPFAPRCIKFNRRDAVNPAKCPKRSTLVSPCSECIAPVGSFACRVTASSLSSSGRSISPEPPPFDRLLVQLVGSVRRRTVHRPIGFAMRALALPFLLGLAFGQRIGRRDIGVGALQGDVYGHIAALVALGVF
jgi:hypothetical protein